MPPPYLSVVMPTYNRADLLPEILESYLVQRDVSAEIVVVDDQSTDTTVALLEQYADQGVRCVTNTRRKGVATARDVGVEQARGEVIVVADSDDPSYPTRLRLIQDHFQGHPDTDVFYTNFDLWFFETGEVRPRFFQPFNRELLTIVNFIPNASSAYRRASFKRLTDGYDPQFEIGEDYDLWLTFAERGAIFRADPSSQVRVRMHAQSVRSLQRDRHKGFLTLNRVKHHLPLTPSVKRLKELAEPEVAAFFTSPEKSDLWFGPPAAPQDLTGTNDR
ncbi:glycosyltransferase family 2 protein [Candidatus Berkelbacteria bacterium]|nr:glycosyltransferase family 2 protein [Candidatus Berkelbacteria bacterium]